MTLLSCVQSNTWGATELQSRLKVARMIYSMWTSQGTDQASLAQRYVDGAVDALDMYLTAQDPHPASGEPAPAGPKSAGALGNCMKLHPSGPGAATATSFPRRHASQLSVDAFTAEFMAANMPVSIEASLIAEASGSSPPETTKPRQALANMKHAGCGQGVTEGWRACKDWVTPDGAVDLQRLAASFGDARIWATASGRCCTGLPHLPMCISAAGKQCRQHDVR